MCQRVCFTRHDWVESQLLHRVPPKHHYLQIILLGPIQCLQRKFRPVSGLRNMLQTAGVWGAEQVKGAGGSHHSVSRMHPFPLSATAPLSVLPAPTSSSISPGNNLTVGWEMGSSLANCLIQLAWSVVWPSGIFYKITRKREKVYALSCLIAH